MTCPWPFANGIQSHTSVGVLSTASLVYFISSGATLSALRRLNDSVMSTMTRRRDVSLRNQLLTGEICGYAAADISNEFTDHVSF